MRITISNITKVDPTIYGSKDPIYYWVTVNFFKEVNGRGISASIVIDIDYEENLKISNLEENAIMKAKKFMALTVAN
jgi:hypothetical protein